MKQLRSSLLSTIIVAATLLSSMVSCDREDSIIGAHQNKIDNLPSNNRVDTNSIITLESALVNVFASSVLQTYYLWIDELDRSTLIENVLNPDTCAHPEKAIKKVLSPEDRWTALYDNMTELINSSSGIETTYGMDATPYLIESGKEDIVIVVNFVYEGSPAAKAGIKRGDLFISMNTIPFTIDNYQDFYKSDKTIKLGYGKYGPSDAIISAREYVELTPVQMYEEPVLNASVFEIDDKKVGYLAYSQFPDSLSSLYSTFSYFKDENISELILDLRYNGGGFVSTAVALASMIAPREAVENEDVVITNVYNKAYTKFFNDNKIELENRFDKKYLPYNVDIKKVYALVSGNTASASELVLVCLNSYIDLTIIGEQTHGKFCSGIMFTPEDYYDWSDEAKDFYKKYKNDFKDWGIYVMIGSFADKNGRNDSRPNGFTPDLKQKDDPFDGYQLGDTKETLLHRALILAGMKFTDKDANTRAMRFSDREAISVERPSFAIKDMPKKISSKSL